MAAQAREMSPGELVAKINQIIEETLGFGEDVPQILSELRAIRDSTGRIGVLVAKHFKARGRAASGNELKIAFSPQQINQVFNDPTVSENERKLMAACTPKDPTKVVAASDAGRSAGIGTGTSPIERGGIRDIIMFIISNPQLWALILDLFKMTNPT